MNDNDECLGCPEGRSHKISNHKLFFLPRKMKYFHSPDYYNTVANNNRSEDTIATNFPCTHFFCVLLNAKFAKYVHINKYLC